MIDKGADPNVKDKYGRTSLMLAVEKNYKDVVKVLLANDANVNSQNIFGWTA